MVGYDSNSTNYRLLDMETKRITTSRHVVFQEDVAEKGKPKKYWAVMNMPVIENHEDKEHPEVIDEDDEMVEEEIEEAEEQEQTAHRLRDRSNLRKPARYEAHCRELEVPQSIEEALTGSEAKEWQMAIDEEIAVMEENNTWKAVDQLPENHKAVSSKIVFKKKLDSQGRVEKCKARLSARRYTQRPGIDYKETFAPLIKFESIRILLALAAKEDWEIAQFDIKTAFLNGNLDEEIYMELPTCVKNGKSLVRLIKSIYGLKQSLRQQNKRFDKFLKRFEFKASSADRYVYIGEVRNVKVILALYVDDGLLMSISSIALSKVMDRLRNEFEITIGNNQYFVGLELKRDRSKRKLFIGQSNYLRCVIDKFNMTRKHLQNIILICQRR